MRHLFAGGFAIVLLSNAASAQVSLAPPEPVSATPVIMAAAQPQPDLGGGFIEFLFGGSTQHQRNGSQTWYGPPPEQNYYRGEQDRQAAYTSGDRSNDRIDPRFLRQDVAYDGKEAPGTVVIDTPNHFLYLVESEGRAVRYGIGVGRPGFTWSGRHAISSKKEWPDWVPPDEMVSHIFRISSLGVQVTPWARARCISVRRSTAFTDPTSPGRSAKTYRQAAFACAMWMSSTFTSA